MGAWEKGFLPKSHLSSLFYWKKNMGITKVGILKSSQAGAKVVSNLPTHPSDYYGTARNDVDSVTWAGGEVCYLSSDNRFYVQTATSGLTATWKRKLEQTISAA